MYIPARLENCFKNNADAEVTYFIWIDIKSPREFDKINRNIASASVTYASSILGWVLL